MENQGQGIEWNQPEQLSLEALKDILSRWTTEPLGNDTRIKAFAEVALGILEEEGTRAQQRDMSEFEAMNIPSSILDLGRGLRSTPLTDALSLMIEFQYNPSVLGLKEHHQDSLNKASVHTPLHAVNLFLRSMNHVGLLLEEERNGQRLVDIWHQKKLITAPPSGEFSFPSDYADKDAWKHLFSYVLTEFHLLDILEFDLTNRRVQTNIPGRYKGFHLPAIILAENRFKKPLKWLDIGCSIGLGNKLEISGEPHRPLHSLGVTPTEIWQRPQDGLYYDDTMSRYLNGILEEPLKFETIVGIDLIGVKDRDQELWTKACGYTSEINNQIIMERNDRLSKVEDHRLHFFLADATNPDSVDRAIEQSPANRFNIITIFTMLNQLSEEERVKVINKALELLEPDGALIIQDFAELNPASPSGFDFLSEWPAYSYATYMIDTRHSAQPQLLYRWNSGRCEELIVPEGSYQIQL